MSVSFCLGSKVEIIGKVLYKPTRNNILRYCSLIYVRWCKTPLSRENASERAELILSTVTCVPMTLQLFLDSNCVTIFLQEVSGQK